MAENSNDLKTWFYAFLVMVSLSIVAFAFSFYGYVVFNPAFEICIFYVPTTILVAAVLCLWMRRTGQTKQSSA